VSHLRERAEIFKILSVETRIRMLELLKDRSLCVNALAKHLGISPAAVSQHLRILRNAGAVVPEKRGYFVHYRLKRETLELWSERIQEILRLSPAEEKPLRNSRNRGNTAPEWNIGKDGKENS